MVAPYLFYLSPQPGHFRSLRSKAVLVASYSFPLAFFPNELLPPMRLPAHSFYYILRVSGTDVKSGFGSSFHVKLALVALFMSSCSEIRFHYSRGHVRSDLTWVPHVQALMKIRHMCVNIEVKRLHSLSGNKLHTLEDFFRMQQDQTPTMVHTDLSHHVQAAVQQRS